MARKAYDAYWAELSPCEHVVQIYEDDAVLLESLADFVRSGLDQGEAAVVIATPEHRKSLQARLSSKGTAVAAAENSDRLILLDAEETMSRFLVDKWPDEELFREVIGEILERAKGEGRKVRAFGEMVALMWAQGFCGATIRLEHLWTDLCREQAFSVFCAYPRIGFTGDAADDIHRVCEMHTAALGRRIEA